MTALYPVFLRVSSLRCVMIGGGAVAARKARGLLGAGARLTVVSPKLHPDLTALVTANRIRWLSRPANNEDVESADLVFLCTPDASLNARLESAAQRAGALVNRADSPDDGTFHVPALVRRGDVAVAVSSGGRSPAFARLLRQEIEQVLTAERLELLEVIAEARENLHADSVSATNSQWRGALHDEHLLSLVASGEHAAAVRYVVSLLKDAALTGSAR